jgi:flagellar biosynthesis/type III secretory pathway chaperone
MNTELLDTITSLTAVIEEETDLLGHPRYFPDLAAMASAKSRLVGNLDLHTTRLSRENPNWMQDLAPEEREQLAAGVAVLRDASEANGRALERQIELSTDLMASVAAEVQRLMGTRNATYGAHGNLCQLEQATPISLNARF